MNSIELAKKMESILRDKTVRREIIDLFVSSEGCNSFKDVRLFVFFLQLALSNSFEEYSNLLDDLKLYLSEDIHIRNVHDEISATEHLVSYLQDEILYRKQEYSPSLNQSSQDESNLRETTEDNM